MHSIFVSDPGFATFRAQFCEETGRFVCAVQQPGPSTLRVPQLLGPHWRGMLVTLMRRGVTQLTVCGARATLIMPDGRSESNVELGKYAAEAAGAVFHDETAVPMDMN